MSEPRVRLVERADGSFSTVEAFERDQAISLRIARRRSEYLDRQRPRPHRLDDHAMNRVTLTCEICGITDLDFHAVPFGRGLPCANDASAAALDIHAGEQ